MLPLLRRPNHGLIGELHPTSFKIEISDYDTAALSYYALMLPVLAKFTFRPGRFLFAGFGGVYFTIHFAMIIDYADAGRIYELGYTIIPFL